MGGLLGFSPYEISELLLTQLSRSNPFESNTSTLLISLAGSLIKVYSNPSRHDLSPQISNLLNRLTDSILPPLALPDLGKCPLKILQSALITPYRDTAACNPELLFEYFGFLSRTIPRYSGTWAQGEYSKVDVLYSCLTG